MLTREQKLKKIGLKGEYNKKELSDEIVDLIYEKELSDEINYFSCYNDDWGFSLLFLYYFLSN
jgi:hypothetical protein